MVKKQPMRVIALAATKGGVGKSTLTATLAVRAAQDCPRVALVDHDPQLSLSSWHDRRGSPGNPKLFEDIDSSSEAIGWIAHEGWDYLFLDTPPSQLDLIETVISCADFVLIPTRPGILDIEAVKITEEMCQQQRKPFAFILNMVQPGAQMTAAAAAHLRTNRRVLLEPFISYRQSHSSAMFAGKSAGEVRDATAKQEIEALWAAVQKFIAKASKVRT